jgi:hypothetical protein
MGKTKTQLVTPKHDVQAITEALSAPFDLQEVRFKPAVVSGNRALALAYVDARVIQDRLDDVLGVLGWQDNYKVLEDGSVVCRLRLRIGEEWVTKVDVGSPSDQGDAGDRRKAAFSDSLKRAAVKFGVGRYLYRLPSQWVDYDPHKKQFVQPPRLPPFALPTKAAEPAAAKSEKPPLKKNNGQAAVALRPEKFEVKPAVPAPANMPANGPELQRRLYDYDAKLAKQGLFPQGALVKHVVEEGIKAGYEPDLATWSGDAILFAAEATRAYEAQTRSAGKPRKEVA